MKYIKTKLYKYRKIDFFTVESIITNSIHFSSPDMFNDPFDCMTRVKYEGNDTDWSKFFAREHMRDKSVIEMQKFRSFASSSVFDSLEHTRQLLSETRICCLSRSNDELLMWSHYADNHRGICIEYSSIYEENNDDIHIMLFNPDDVYNYVGKDFPTNGLSVFKVDYQSQMPTILNKLKDDDSEMIRFIKTKSVHWKYENEYRLYSDASILKGKNTVRLIDGAITGIIFGLKVAEEQKDLIKIIAMKTNPDVKFYNAVSTPGFYSIQIQ